MSKKEDTVNEVRFLAEEVEIPDINEEEHDDDGQLKKPSLSPKLPLRPSRHRDREQRAKTMHEFTFLRSDHSGLGVSSTSTATAISNNINTLPGSSYLEPLTWREARYKMREILKSYMESELVESNMNMNIAADGETERNTQSICSKMVQFWFQQDMDCYTAILVSLVLHVISTVFLVKSRGDSDNGTSSEKSETLTQIHTTQIIASVFFLGGSIMSTWLLRRRRYTSARGAETKKRKMVESFLPVLDEMLDDEELDSNGSNDTSGGDVDNSPSTSGDESGKELELSGTSLTDLYLVFRMTPGGGGKWHRVPSLLLVKGDFVELQLGDTAPAACRLVTGSKVGSNPSLTSLKMMSTPDLRTMNKEKAAREPIILQAGERVEPPAGHRGAMARVDSNHHHRTVHAQVCDNLFPPGKSYLSEHSRKLMHLCNHSRVYQVQESPLANFLRKKSVPPKVPQVHRRFAEIRIALYLFSIVLLILSYVVIFIRHSIEEIDAIPLSICIPLFIALGSLPVATPIITILIEIIGTVRILVTVHFASTRVRVSDQKLTLFPQYFVQGVLARLQLHLSNLSHHLFNHNEETSLFEFPMAGDYLFEKLGVITVLSLVDDELACDPISTPQRLLIPSSSGLKLLDLFPKYEDDSDDDSSVDSNKDIFSRRRARSFASSNDSDSDWGYDHPPEDNRGSTRNIRMLDLVRIRRRFKRKKSYVQLEAPKPPQVQFEDPSWWHHLPSLKCVGLAGLLVDNKEQRYVPRALGSGQISTMQRTESDASKYIPGMAEASLVRQVCSYYDRSHLRVLSQCIGFMQQPNSFGERGDISFFEEVRRIRVIATRLLRRRMLLNRHQISTEESRSWGVLRPDSTSVIVRDSRSMAYQLLSVGDARVVTDLCSDSWQGETITPLSAIDREAILDASKTWSLADLDVTAFSYAPVPYTYTQKSVVQSHLKGVQPSIVSTHPMTYLIDNRTSGDIPATVQKDHGIEDWSLIKNQIFLGLLGSSVSPRKDTTALIEDCTNAGVRFVYFSPRNMRRTKELASQMGIDVAWNCAISLRPLDEGEDTDEHRMTSNYADWDVNAKLPHGVEDVRRHLEEVDNVPLLVSIFTDVTKENTAEMINIFRSHGNDTVLSLGLSHISLNDDAFSSSDLAIGNDALCDQRSDTNGCEGENASPPANKPVIPRSSLHPKEISFITKIASHSCVFNLALGQNGLLNMEEILAEGRAALSAGTAAGHFVVAAMISLSLTLFLCLFTASSSIPVIPAPTMVLYIQLYIPLIGLAMCFSFPDKDSMTIVPPKNDETVVFAMNERKRIAAHITTRAMLPAISSFITYLIAFGTLALAFDPNTIGDLCDIDASTSNWTNIITCRNLTRYLGKISCSASSLMLTELVLCIIAQSASFLLGNEPILKSNLLAKNGIWAITSLCCIGSQFIYLYFILERGTLQALPWYFYLFSLVTPLLCLVVCEYVKTRDKKFEVRAQTLRRLQFETRLGMWSPK